MAEKTQLMTTEDMMRAMSLLGGKPSIRLDAGGHWYIEQCGVRVMAADGFDDPPYFERGTDPTAAVQCYWVYLTALKHGQYIEFTRGEERAHARWGGDGWIVGIGTPVMLDKPEKGTT